MEILEGMNDEKLTREDRRDGITNFKDEPIENGINEYLMTPAQASKTVSELAFFGQPIGAKIKNDALDDIWSPSPELRSVSVLPAIVIGKELTKVVPFSRNQSWINASEQGNLIPSSHRPDDSETSNSLGMRFIRNTDDSSLSSVSLETVLRGRKDCTLRKAEPFFTDSTGYYFNVFWTKLEGLNGRTSEGPLCIEKYLVQSEKDWLKRIWGARMGNQRGANQTSNGSPTSPQSTEESDSDSQDHFLLQGDYNPPTGLKKFFFLLRVGEWPLYSFLLHM